MALIDDVYITVKAGNGGNGATVTKQIFGSKKTAPDGGNGGNGGNVYFKADRNVSDLSEFRYKKEIRGQDGIMGLRKDLDGANGKDVTLLVPFGTTITNENTKEYIELTSDLPFCVAYGGQGGMGNHDFNPSIQKFTKRVSEGAKGDEVRLHLVLNLIAEVGLVGLPNAGKSSLLKSLTNATPKIGNYPFTTLEPNLGVLDKKVVADIPGLIKGASKGKGLGISFLKHIKKTKILLHCLDSSEKDLMGIYEAVRKEFSEFDPGLLEKREIILLTKADLLDKKDLKKKIAVLSSLDRQILPVSIYDEKSLELVRKTLKV